jgi:hypothetical protein
MSDRIKVLPGHENARGLLHPIDGELKDEGSLWTYDGFTCRLLTDGDIRRAPEDPPAAAPPAAELEASAAADSSSKRKA